MKKEDIKSESETNISDIKDNDEQIKDENTSKDIIEIKEDKLYNSLDELNNTFNVVFGLLKKGSITRSTLKNVDKKYKLIQKNVLKFNNFAKISKKLIPLGGINAKNLNQLKNVQCEGFAIMSEVKKKPAKIFSLLF